MKISKGDVVQPTILTKVCILLFTAIISAQTLPDGLYAKIETTKGPILISFYFEQTPLTVCNFVGLAEGTLKNTPRPNVPYFNKMVIHRYVSGFVIQTGDPTGTGTGGPGYSFRDEFVSSLKHDKAGVLSMANSGPKTNGSQFFITLGAASHLNGVHTVFGRVVDDESMVTVKKLLKGDSLRTVTILRVGEKANAFKTDQKTFDNLKNGVSIGIQKQSTNNFNPYVAVNNGLMTISSPLTSNSHIRISTIQGKIVYDFQTPLTTGVTTVKGCDLPAGVWVVSIKTGNESVSRTIISR